VSAARGAAWSGPTFAVVGVLGFSFKAILIKLAYAWSTVDATTLLTLRMLYSAPLFLAMAWWAGRGAPPLTRRDLAALAWLGFIGYYLASLLDFLGLAYISASLERLVLFLYPTIVILLTALLHRTRIAMRDVVAVAISYAGILVAFSQDLTIAQDPHDTLVGGGLVFASAVFYALYLVQSRATISRLGSMRFVAWAMIASTACIVAHYATTHPWPALAVPARIHMLSATMAVVSTVVPVWMVAEAIRRIGANASSLIGSFGPVFTIGLGALILGEPVTPVQLLGAALVLGGVAVVTLRPKTSAAAAASVRDGAGASRARE
jgi:drug/metabolite transporter (DMT)-like permease